jgi:hypothetical protein
MSSYVIYYSGSKEFYRGLAERWLRWSVEADLSATEVEGMIKFFGHVAKRFGLIKEFRQLGIL